MSTVLKMIRKAKGSGFENTNCRERSGDEFYFISLDPVNGQRLGVFRLYNFTDTSFGTGSWLYKPGLRNQPILGNITGKEIGFDYPEI